MTLSRVYRLRSRADFDRVFRKGKALHGDFFFLKYVHNDLSIGRFACSVPTKAIKSAVERNNIRRQISSIYEQSGLKTRSYDMILVIQKVPPSDRAMLKQTLGEIFRNII